MNGAGEIDPIRTKFKLSELWEQDFHGLWTSPSSPPYIESSSPRSISPAATRRSSTADQLPSSPGTPSEFEFDSMAAADMREEAPASPKFLSSFGAGGGGGGGGYWSPQISSSLSDFIRPDGAIRTVEGHVAEKSRIAERSSDGDLEVCTPSPAAAASRKTLDYTHVPRSPPREPLDRAHVPLNFAHVPLNSAHVPLSPPREQSIAEDRRSSADTSPYPDLGAAAGTRGLRQSRSSIASSSSSSSSWFAMHAWDINRDEDKSSGSSTKKAWASRSLKRWAFKDLLRRTVPSSKADASFLAKTLGAPSSSKSFANPRSTPTSPKPSYPSKSLIDSTLPIVRPSFHSGPRSPKHLQSSTHASSTTYSSPTLAQSEAHMLQHASSRTQTPAPSPPQSPISQHVAHYRLQKAAQSHELTKKTFLPYRQSLFGCLGGSSAFSSDQVVW